MGEIGESQKVAKVLEGALCLSSAAITELLDISPQTLSEWVAKGMPRTQRGWYPLKSVLAWRGEIRPEGSVGKAVNLQQRKLEVEIALKESQQELTQLKADITNGKYIEVEVVNEELRRFFVILKRAMLAVPRRVGGMASAYIDPVEARQLEKDVKDSVMKTLNSFADSVVIGNV